MDGTGSLQRVPGDGHHRSHGKDGCRDCVDTAAWSQMFGNDGSKGIDIVLLETEKHHTRPTHELQHRPLSRKYPRAMSSLIQRGDLSGFRAICRSKAARTRPYRSPAISPKPAAASHSTERAPSPRSRHRKPCRCPRDPTRGVRRLPRTVVVAAFWTLGWLRLVSRSHGRCCCITWASFRLYSLSIPRN